MIHISMYFKYKKTHWTTERYNINKIRWDKMIDSDEIEITVQSRETRKALSLDETFGGGCTALGLGGRVNYRAQPRYWD